jgi:hypothetical protein
MHLPANVAVAVDTELGRQVDHEFYGSAGAASHSLIPCVHTSLLSIGREPVPLQLPDAHYILRKY